MNQLHITTRLVRMQGFKAMSAPRPNHHGMALITVLLFLVAITGLAVWTARQSILGEGMARNQLDREAAHEAAEAALRDAERDLTTISPTLIANASCSRNRSGPPIVYEFTATCTTGYCFKEDGDYANSNWSTASASVKTVAEPWWPTSKGGGWNNGTLTIGDNKPGRTPVTTTNCNFTGGVPLGTFTGIAPIAGVAVQPEYIIELFDNTKISAVTKQEEPVYRITARGFGYTQRTQVVLQTIFIPLQE